MEIQIVLNSSNPLDIEVLQAVAKITQTSPVPELPPHTENVPGQEAPTAPPRRKPGRPSLPSKAAATDGPATPAAVAPAPEPVAEKAPAPAPVPAVPAPNEEKFRAFATRYDKTLGIARLKEHLAKAGVRRLSELPADVLPGFLAEREAELNKATDTQEVV